MTDPSATTVTDLARALADIDAARLECPVESKNPAVRRASAKVCAVCQATPRDSCQRFNPWGVIEAARSAVAAVTALYAERDALKAENDRLRSALSMYADPSFYHGCGFEFYRPTGGFEDDFDHDSDYGREMPGKLARAALNTGEQE
jgi:hypothetical protein